MTPMNMISLGGAVFSLCFLFPACKSEALSRQETSPSSKRAEGMPGGSAFRKLGDLDNRQPVPLQPMMAWHQKQNMMQHLVVIQRIIGGLAAKNWDQVTSASALIESSKAMQTMCKRMGKGAPGFTEIALDFHRRADAIGKAARAHNVMGVLRTTSNTLQACTVCHATYRQEVMDAATWRKRTGSN